MLTCRALKKENTERHYPIVVDDMVKKSETEIYTDALVDTTRSNHVKAISELMQTSLNLQ